MNTKELSHFAHDLYNEVLNKICANPEVAGSALSQEYVLAEVTKLLSQELSMWLWSDFPKN